MGKLRHKGKKGVFGYISVPVPCTCCQVIPQGGTLHMHEDLQWTIGNNKTASLIRTLRLFLKPSDYISRRETRAQRLDLRIHLLSSQRFTVALFKEASTWHTVWSDGSRWKRRCTSPRRKEKPSFTPRRGATMLPETPTWTRWEWRRSCASFQLLSMDKVDKANCCLQAL